MKKCLSLISLLFLSVAFFYGQEYADDVEEIEEYTEEDFDDEYEYVMSSEEFDILFESDSVSNYEKNLRKFSNEEKKSREKTVAALTETVQTQTDTSVKKVEIEPNKKTGVSVDVGFSTTNMFSPTIPAVMYPIADNPYFTYVDMKFTGALNQFVYGGITIDCGIGEYGKKLNIDVDETQYCYDVSLLTGFSLNLGNNFRFFVEDNVSFSLNVINQTKPTRHKARWENAWGYGIGGGFDIIINDIFLTLGYNYNWKHYFSNAENFAFFNSDYSQTIIYAGIGLTW